MWQFPEVPVVCWHSYLMYADPLRALLCISYQNMTFTSTFMHEGLWQMCKSCTLESGCRLWGIDCLSVKEAVISNCTACAFWLFQPCSPSVSYIYSRSLRFQECVQQNCYSSTCRQVIYDCTWDLSMNLISAGWHLVEVYFYSICLLCVPLSSYLYEGLSPAVLLNTSIVGVCRDALISLPDGGRWA